jgi:hypothetical protein
MKRDCPSLIVEKTQFPLHLLLFLIHHCIEITLDCSGSFYFWVSAMLCDMSHFLTVVTVTTRYGLLHYANLIRRTGPYCFSFNLLNLATPLLSYAVRLVLLIVVLLSSLPCYLYDAVLILTSDILYSLIDTFLSILRYINSHVFIVEP